MCNVKLALFVLVLFHVAIADAACQCKNPKDLVTNMPMEGNQYKYTEGGKSYLLPDTYGGTCKGWDADPVSSGFAGGWGCPADWCHNKWCYVDPCACSEHAIGQTFMFTGVSLYFSYGLCCAEFTSAATCGGQGAGECTWDTATSKCLPKTAADAYINARCKSKGTDETTCKKFSSCQWVSNACTGKSAADRRAALSCASEASVAERNAGPSLTALVVLGAFATSVL